MMKLNTALLTLAVALSLGGCIQQPEEHWTSGETPKKLHVDHLRMKFVAMFAAGSADLSKEEIARLDAFLDQSGVRHNDHVYIEASASDRMATTRIGRLAKELDRRGLGAQTIPAEADGPTQNQVAMLVDRYVVSLPDCPNWTPPADDDHGNNVGSNFGCANMTNLGLMIDDPRDLVMGRTPGPSDAEPIINSVARYHNDKVKPLTGGSSSGGAGGGAPAAGASPGPAAGGPTQ